MTEPTSQLPTPKDSWLEPGKLNLQVIYALYLVSLAVGISSIIAIVLAYLNRGKAGGWLETHYTWAIRTFWIGLLYSLISLVLSFVFIGILGFIATMVWFVVRCVVGLQKVSRDEPIANPQRWMI